MDLIKKYFSGLTSEKQEKLTAYAALLKEWNQKINLISKKDEVYIVERHILHSLSIYRFIPLPEGSSILDIGSGGGLPGIPLAIAFPGCTFTLIDSIRKKTVAMQEMVMQLELSNTAVVCGRAEQLHKKYHFITGRAVASLPEFEKTARPLLLHGNCGNLKNGILYLKGGEFEKEQSSLRGKSQTFLLKEIFAEDFFATKKLVYIF
ncbi:MAG: 16S rRNA (guanine(527)-N(7))-methyltransferase RsmG [Bacteroidales bacterium]|nr:16S rRNA (guanine(527)-N(7))-methyltransferase RsmG [Bacteroidales bacterium]